MRTIENMVCYNCTNLKNITIPENISFLDGASFANCDNLSDVFCYASIVPSTNNAFTIGNIANATLHVPGSALEAYSSTSPWNSFGTIVANEEPTSNKCATPVLTYHNGKINCSCETEGVKYKYSVVSASTSSGESSDGQISLGTVFIIKVHATHEGYEDSEEASIKVNLAETGDMNGDGTISIADVTGLVNVILGK